MTTELPINHQLNVIPFRNNGNSGNLDHPQRLDEKAREANSETEERPMSEREYAMAFQAGFHKTVRFLRSRGAREDVAEEVAQAAWARGWERLHQLRNPEAVRVWVASIAKHLWRNRIVKEQRQQELTDSVATRQQSDAGILWDQIVSACGPDEKRLLSLHYVNGFNSREIAEQLGCSPLAVRLRLMRVRRKLDQSVSSDLLLRAA